ncbi:DUF5819 family protein [Clavibacter michiganensis]|uniref:Uncharacterized protein n=1 Tax=Clavibacter michiganensis subsp. insidiosus TaxID=33014 RepID=A0A0D5CJC3_9MICO|nr:DUF5819 family protein [Clavibacter michiganensis]AJW79716.1 hypothetical protein VO01_11790 [Clavibacter michiganensis subsp. insidiosus]AWF99097.1 hypothetical protein BEH61_11345 [Clavibacter michiganensis subsp. insidiosus]
MTDTTHDHDVAHEVDDDSPSSAPPPADPAPPADPTTPGLTRGARIGTAIAAVVVAIYVATSILMVVPQSDATRALTAAARPYFSQQWNVFAPSIQKTNRYLEMQAQWRDDSGALVKSEWVDITRAEYAAGEGRIQSSRTVKQSANLLKTYTERFRGLTPEQQVIVQDTFIRRADTDSGFAAKTAVSLIDQLSALDEGSRGRVITMLRADYVLKEFTTYWSTAWFGRDIERVRWRVATERPNDFAHRSDDQQQFAPSTRTFGWREADDVIDPQALSVYQGIVERYAR